MSVIQDPEIGPRIPEQDFRNYFELSAQAGCTPLSWLCFPEGGWLLVYPGDVQTTKAHLANIAVDKRTMGEKGTLLRGQTGGQRTVTLPQSACGGPLRFKSVVSKPKILVFPPNSWILFRQDLVHAGFSYQTTNIRYFKVI